MEYTNFTPVYDEKTTAFLETQFLRMKDECYMDHAGATLYSDDQITEIMKDLLSSQYANPHSYGVIGNATDDAVNNIRYLILDHFHTTQEEYSVIFTSGATAAIKLIADTFDFDPQNDSAGTFAYLQDNHTSVLGVRELLGEKNVEITCIDHQTAFEKLNDLSQIDFNKVNKNNSLFVYSAQCNFSGIKYPLTWIDNIKKGNLNYFLNTKSNWYTLLDAASFAATNKLNLNNFKPDFVCISFYKLFGYPSGLGALLVKNSSAYTLKKVYYGGGTVKVALSSRTFHVKKDTLHERFEDGTIPYLSIISLKHGFETISKISMNQISKHVFNLARYCYHSLLNLHHENGAPVAKLYADTDYSNRNFQGGIVTFNILRSNGEYVGYMEVLHLAALYKIHLRTGCFCNPGACQRHLSLTNKDVLKNYDSGYTCGGDKDLVNGKPTGAVRVSFGYMSSEKDVNRLLLMIEKCFLTGTKQLKTPVWWNEFQLSIVKKFRNDKISLISYNSDINVTKEKYFQEKIVNTVKDCNNINSEFYKIKSEQNSIKKSNLLYKLEKLFIYPIKSCGAYQIQDSWKLTPQGLLFDREWMIVSSNGVCLTQKQEPNMCLITPIIHLKKNEFELNYPGMPSIKISLQNDLNEINKIKICKGKVCGHQVKGIDSGAAVSEWLSLALKRPNLRLLRQYKDRTEENNLSFASQSQYLLVNNKSIMWLADKISSDSECDKKTILYRFRGNIIIGGSTAFEEITWKNVKIGNCQFEVEGQCSRCQMVCIDQLSGKKTVEPLRTLAEEFHGKLKFGIYLKKASTDECELKIGDTVIYS